MKGRGARDSPSYSSFILGCINTAGCMGPGTPSINQIKQQFGLQPEVLDSILQIDNYDKAIGRSHKYSMNETSSMPAISSATIVKQTLRPLRRDKACPQPTAQTRCAIKTFRQLRASLQSALDFGERRSLWRRVFHLTPTGAGYEPSWMCRTRGQRWFYRQRFLLQRTQFEAQENSPIFTDTPFKFGGGFEPVWINAEHFLQSWCGHFHAAESLAPESLPGRLSVRAPQSSSCFCNHVPTSGSRFRLARFPLPARYTRAAPLRRLWMQPL